ncbi:MAG: hypothetical protein M9899_06575 [Bdellovibrionaceae bacterium]|nr:hypothetical protein [Pseudobdellovibrionaceae bacterium]
MKAYMNVTFLCVSVLGLAVSGCQSTPKKQAANQEEAVGRLIKPHLGKEDFRGGSTSGADVVMDNDTGSKYFQAIQEAKTKKEKDRQAILAQVGDYKVSFEFIETFAFDKSQALDKPYFSWATEYIFPLEVKDNFISLQHILVMTMKEDSGKTTEPYVVKHWRQDWTYEAKDMLTFVGNMSWKTTQLTPAQWRGAWVQAVYQVDDSPRYNAVGKWVHTPDFSTWDAESAWRPLPRREHTQRSDYQALDSKNRVTVTPTGWYHEQDNVKVVVDPKTQKPTGYITREIGFNRYERIKDYDFSVGKEYWNKTAPYWASVRKHWDDVIKKTKAFSLADEVADKKLYKYHFEFANQIVEDSKDKKDFKADANVYKTHATKTIDSFVRKN